jgi:hypothetical protein
MRIIFREASGCRLVYQMLKLLNTEVEVGIQLLQKRGSAGYESHLQRSERLQIGPSDAETAGY